MNKENFRILKEINSLHQKLATLAKEIEDEMSRYQKVSKILTSKKDELASKEAQHQELRSTIQHKENQLETHYMQQESSQNKLSAITSDKEVKPLEQQIRHAKEQISLLDEELLELMQAEENSMQEINKLKKYIAGAPAGLKEIEADIKQENHPRVEEVERFKNRKEKLLGQLPENVKEHFTKLIEQNLPKSTVTQLDDKNHCAFCGTQMAGPVAKEVETQLAYKSCSGCKRVVIPASSLYL